MAFNSPENSKAKPAETMPPALPSSASARENIPAPTAIPGTKNASGEYTPTPEEQEAIDKDWEGYVKQGQEAVNRIHELYDQHIATTQLGEVPLNEAYKIRNQQKDEAAKIYNKTSAEVDRLAKANHWNRAKLQQEIQSAYERAKLESDILIQNNKNLLAMLGLIKETDKFTPEQIVRLQSLLGGLAKLGQKHDKTSDAIMAKLSPNEGIVDRSLTPADLSYIISKINPIDLQRISSLQVSAKEIFDASAVGIFLHFMSPKQHVELLRQMAKIPDRKADLPDLVNAMLLAGFLQPRQAEQLFAEGIIPPADYQTKIAPKIENGFYAKTAQAIEEKIAKEAKEMQNSQFIHSPAEEVFSSQGFGGIVAIHGAGLFLVNALMAGFGFSEMANNPYIGFALLEMLYGTETATATKKGVPGVFGDSDTANFLGLQYLGSGVIGQGIRKLDRYLSEDANGEPMDQAKHNAYKLLGNWYMQNTRFGDFLNDGGLAIVTQLHDEKEKAHQQNPAAPKTFTYDELFACATTNQRIFLTRAVAQSSKETVEAHANGMSDIATILNIENKKQLDYYLCEIQKDYGIN